MNHNQWLDERQKGIGGSDAAAILGLNPYKTNVELWQEKTGLTKAEDISGKPYVKYGIRAESFLRELFQLDYPQYEVIYDCQDGYKIHKNKDYPFIFATLDGIIFEKETGRKGVLEIKTTNILQSMQREKWHDQIPENYYVQILHQLLATGYDFVKLKAHLKSEWQGEVRNTQRHYHIERIDVEEDLKYLLNEEIKFWNEYVLKNKKPPLKLPTI